MLKIRPMVKEDAESVAKMRHLLWSLHARNCNFISMSALKKQDATSDLKKGAKSKTHVLVADLNGKICGYLLFEFRKAEDFFKFRNYLYLDELFVAAVNRRSGIGRALFNSAQKTAKAKKMPIIARIYPFSDPMRNLFKSSSGDELYGVFIKR